MGRPSTYSVDIAADICQRLAMGEPLTKICRDENMPNPATVYKWLIAQPVFTEMYTRAREDQADTMADEIVSISDEASNEDVNVARLRVDARKWVAAKLKPRKYSDRLQTEHSGSVDLSSRSDADLDAELSALLQPPKKPRPRKKRDA